MEGEESLHGGRFNPVEYIENILGDFGDKERKALAMHDLGVLMNVLAIISEVADKEEAEVGEEIVGVASRIVKEFDSLSLLDSEKELERIEKLKQPALQILELAEASGEFSEHTFHIRMSKFLLNKGMNLLVWSALFLSRPTEEVFEKLDGLTFSLDEILEAFELEEYSGEKVELNWAGALIFINLLRNAKNAINRVERGEIRVISAEREGKRRIEIFNPSIKGLPSGYGEKPLIDYRYHFGGFLARTVLPPLAGVQVRVTSRKLESGLYKITSYVEF